MTASPDNSLLPDDRNAREQLEAALHRLVRDLYPNNAFYRDRLADAHLPQDHLSLDAFTQQVPFTTRDEWVEDQEAHPPYGTNLTFPISAYTRFSRTSGSTGHPKIWLDTQDSWQAMLTQWQQVYQAAGVTAQNRLFFAFSFGPFLGFWTAFDSASQMGGLCIPGGGLTSDARLQIMAESQVDTLCCTPTYAIHLGQTATAIGYTTDPDERGPQALHVNRIIVAGEPGGSLPATRALISELWGGAEVFDHHGMTEVGPVTYQRADSPGELVVMESAYFAEVIDPMQLTPVAPGEVGELVLTTLKRPGSPLLRYRTGDLVRASRRVIDDGQPSCLVLERGILGRVDDMVVVRGVNIFPSAVENIVRDMPHVSEYEVSIGKTRAMTDLELRVEWTPACPDEHLACEELERRLRNAFALRIPVSAALRDELPRYELKAQRWRSASEADA